jgi:hypothetical protein
MRKSESGDDCVAERGLQQRAAIVSAPLVMRKGPHAELGQFVGKSQSVQDSRRIRANLNSGADFAQRAGLLVHVSIKPSAQKRKCCAKATDTPADNRQSSLHRPWPPYPKCTRLNLRNNLTTDVPHSSVKQVTIMFVAMSAIGP